jgi:hypothetical protein
LPRANPFLTQRSVAERIFVDLRGFVVLQTFKTSPEIDFNVRCIVFNRTGRSLAMAGDTGLVVVDLVPHLSAPSDSSGSVIVCRY